MENAVIHGISPKVEGGKITIWIRSKDDRLLIDISDNGKGMDEELLEKVKKQLKVGEDTAIDADIVGIGLGNVSRRIRTMYEDGSLDISSKEEEGTTIQISIPLQGVNE